MGKTMYDIATEMEILGKYERGSSYDTLGREYNMHPTGIRRIILRNGGEPRGSDPYIDASKLVIPERFDCWKVDSVGRSNLGELFGKHGVSIEKLADLHNCAPYTIYRILEEDGYKTNYIQLPTKISIEQRHQLAEDRTNGASLEELGEKYGISVPYAGAIAKEHGAVSPPRNYSWQKVFEEDYDEIARLYVEERMSLREIAKMYACTIRIISLALESAGVERRPKGSHKRLYAQEAQ